MAHGWDSYFQNLQPLPSDSRALSGSSESEGSFPQHIENLIGDHDFSSIAASQEAPARNSNFDENFYTDPTIENADCVYQRYYGEMPWQSAGEQMIKDCLPRCGNSNISDFSPDELSTSGFHSSFAPDFQELKQDCEMLTSSFHGDFSDLNRDSDADVGETRPSCEFMTSNLDQNPKTTGTIKHTSSEWPFTSTENMSFPNEGLCPTMSETISLLSNPSNVEGGNMVQCAQGKIEGLEKPCTQNDQFSAMSNMVTNTENEVLEGSNDGGGQEQQSQEDVGEERAVTRGKESDPPKSSHENITSERVKEYLDDEEDHHTVIATNSMAKSESVELDDFEVLRLERTETTNPGNDEVKKEKLLNLSSTDGQDGEDENDIQDKEIQTTAFELGSSEEEQVSVIFQNTRDTSESVKRDCKVLRDGRKESNKQEDEAFDKQEMPNPNSADGQDLDMRNDEEDKEIQVPCPKSSDLQSVNVLDSKGTAHKQSETTCIWKSSSQEDESCLQLPECQSTESKAVDNICCDPADIGDNCSVDTSDKEHRFSDCFSGLLTNGSSMDTKPWTSAEHRTNITSSIDQQQSLQPSPVAMESESLCGDVVENTKESFQDLDDPSKEKQLLNDVLQGGHRSEEETSCEADEIKSKTSQCKESSVARCDDNSMNHMENQTSHLKSSTQMRNRLQPIVIMKNSEPTKATNASYRCADCQQTTQSVGHLIEHYHCSHLKHKFQFCQTCNIYMICNEHIEKHLCGGTNATTRLSFDSSLQTRKKHRRGHTCDQCKLVFSKINDYVKHMRTHTGITPYRCNQCGGYFSQSCSLSKHKRIPGRCKGKTQNCPVTTSDAVVIETKQNEIEIETTEDVLESSPVSSLRECYVKLVDICKSHVCHYCGKQYSTANKVRRHYYNVHKRNCGSNVRSSEHTKKVTVDKTTEVVQKKMSGKYKCPLCPRLFKYSYNRARHLRKCVRYAMYGGKGKSGRNYKCPLCPAAFTLASNRYRHVKNICIKECFIQLAKQRAKSKDQKTATETPLPKTGHKCSFCPAVFSHKSGKYRHMKKHELFKTTGKLFRNRRSIFPPTSVPTAPTVPAASTTSKTEGCNETNLSLSCRFCGKKFSTSASLKKHQYNHKGEKPYRCLECGKKFKKHAYLIGHKMVHQRRIQCTVCRKILPTIGELIQHRNSHLKKGMLQCPDCPMQFQYPAYLLRHSASHKIGENQAQQAEEKPPFQTQLPLASLKEQDEPNQHQCSLCREVFDEAQALRKHCLKHISKSSSYKCPFCKRNFTCRRNLVRHMILHTGTKPLSCATCGKRFFSSWYLGLHLEKCSPSGRKHVATSESDNKSKELLKCSHCPRVFSRRNRLKNHHRGHKAKSLLCCLNCGQYYGNTKLTQHKKTCLQTLKRSSDLSKDDYQKTISQTNKVQCSQNLQSSAIEMLPYRCPHCQQRFKYRSLLLRHVVSHTGLQPYSCMHCGHRYASQSVCLQHEAFCDGVYREGQTNIKSDATTHLSDMSSLREAQKPQVEGEFKCKFCTKTFMKPRNLRRHILTHTEVKPYRCKACDCCFSRYDHLKVHQARCKGKRRRLEVRIPKISIDDIGKGWQNKCDFQSSEKQQAFECNVCSRTFSVQSELSRHVSMFHATKSILCTRCGKSYSCESTLKKHKKMKRCRRLSSETKVYVDPPTENVTTVVKSKILQRIKKYKHVCSYCPRTFHCSWQLRVHTRLHTGEKPYGCDDCGEKFIRNDYLQRHWPKCTKRVQQTTSVLCGRCGSCFSKDKIENHRKGCIAQAVSKPTVSQSSHPAPLKGYSCAYCASHFLLFSQLQEHFLNEHKVDTLSNPTVSAVPLQQHLSNLGRIKEEPVEEQCDKQDSEGANVLCNLDPCLEAEIQKPFACSNCKLRFVNKAGLMGHLRVHAKGHPFTCKTCKKGFWNKNLLRNHSRKCIRLATHAGTILKPGSLDMNESVLVLKEGSQTTGTGVLQTNSLCNDDTPSQKSKGDQDQSNSSIQKVVQYQCSECDKSFTDGLLLISHLEDHGRQEQEKKHNTCSKCGRVCSSQANLERHMRMHGIKAKYSCPDCSKKFDTPAEFEIHRICHDPNRIYACRVCNQRFLTKPDLLSHYSEKHPDDIFCCRFCKRIYSAKKSLLKHYRIWHKNEQREEDLDDAVQDKRSTEQQASSPSSTTNDSDEDCPDESSGSSDDSDSAPYFPCHVCGKTFTTSESLEDHQRCHLGEKPHECAECGRCFYQASQLQQHQRMHKSEFQCQTCGRGFVSLFALRKHKRSHGKSRPYRCPKCQLSFTGPAQLAEHMSTHREETFPCDLCNRIFSSKSSRAEHRKIHSQAGGRVPSLVPPEKQSELFSGSTELKYRCGICSARFKDPEELSEHGCMATKERSYSCLDCNIYFLHASHLKKHQATHHHIPSQSALYSCNQCSTSFSSSLHFLNHLKIHDNADAAVEIKDGKGTDSERISLVFMCPVCHQQFTKSTDLINHFPVHSEGAFECKMCKMTFPSKNKLDVHEQYHRTTATQFECTVCSQSFLGSDVFRQHRCSHKRHSNLNPSARKSPVSTGQAAGEDEEIDVTGDDLHNCPVCSKRFASQSGLLEHQNKYHPNQKPFKCEHCGKAFGLRRYLKEHERRHCMKLPAQIKDRPVESKFECSRCRKMFNTAQDLSLHMRMHAEKEVGEYRCDMCYKSFTLWSLLKQHQESHVGQVVYECTECDKAFAFPHLLEEHRHTHNESSV